MSEASREPIQEQDVVDIVIKVLEAVSKRHAQVGRHELNRSDLENVLQEIRVLGLPV